MNIQRTLKKSTKQYIIVAILCVLVIGTAAAIITIALTGSVKDDYELQLTMAQSELEDIKRSVYIATNDIKGGDYITSDNVKREIVYNSQPQDIYITEEDIGKVALIDITAGTHLIKNMVTDVMVSSEIRELEYNVIHVNSNIVPNDTVDIRIIYPNGESYIVLSKKILKGYDLETANCYFWLNEEEIHRMSAAIVDAGLYTGTRLITTKYVEPSIQNESVVTYTPSLAILSLIETDPNIVERCSQELNKIVRKSLENRLASALETDVSEINWNVSNDVFPTVDDEDIPIATPTPTPLPIEVGEIEDTDTQILADNGNNYMYFIQEQEARKGDIEYGE